jgi:hypothetical protein
MESAQSGGPSGLYAGQHKEVSCPQPEPSDQTIQCDQIGNSTRMPLSTARVMADRDVTLAAGVYAPMCPPLASIRLLEVPDIAGARG